MTVLLKGNVVESRLYKRTISSAQTWAILLTTLIFLGCTRQIGQTPWISTVAVDY